MWRFQTVLTVAFAAVLALLVSCLRPLPPLDSEEAYWARKMLWGSDYDLVLVGDSRTNRGVSPEVMKKHLPGMRIINFSFQSTGFRRVYLDAVEQRLDLKHGKKIIVLGVSTISLTPDAAKANKFLEMLRKHPVEIYQEVNLESFLRFFRPIEWQKINATWHKQTGRKIKIFHPDGWVAVREEPPQPGRTLPFYEKYYNGNQVSGEVLDELLDAVKDWTERGIIVFGFRPPTTVEMLRMENRVSGFKEREFAKRFKAAGGTWLRFKHGNYFSYDGSHLQASAARKLSSALAKRIAGHLK